MPLFFLLGGIRFKPDRSFRKVLRFAIVDMWLYVTAATILYSLLSFLIHFIWSVQYQKFSDFSVWNYTTKIWTGNGDRVQLVLTTWFLLAYGWVSLTTFAAMRWVPSRWRAPTATASGGALVIVGISAIAPIYYATGAWWLNLATQVSVGSGFMLLGVAIASSPRAQFFLTSGSGAAIILLAFLWLAVFTGGAIPSIAWSNYLGVSSWLYLLVATAGSLTVLNVAKLATGRAPLWLADLGVASKTIMIHHLAVFAVINLVFVSAGLLDPSSVNIWTKFSLNFTWPLYLIAGLFVPLLVHRKQRAYFERRRKISVDALAVGG